MSRKKGENISLSPTKASRRFAAMATTATDLAAYGKCGKDDVLKAQAKAGME